MQAYSDKSKFFIALLSFFILSLFSLAQDVGILVDRSMSVEQENRNEAIQIINSVIKGKLDQGLDNKWTFIKSSSVESDPYKRKLREELQENLMSILGGQNSDPLKKAETFKLFVGNFGNRDTVHKLSEAGWRKQGDDFERYILDAVNQSELKDAETHFELAKATAASKLPNDRAFYLFVVTDGIEDLVNWPVEKYLDPRKLNNVDSLSNGDFRDDGNANNLINLNNSVKRGQDVKIKTSAGVRVVKGYSASDQATLKKFDSNYEELLIGKISLNAENLASFFTKHDSKKVPVHVSVYRAFPRAQLQVEFTYPKAVSIQSPHTINSDSKAIEWNTLLANKPAENVSQTLSIFENNNLKHTKKLAADSCDILKTFPLIKDGKYEVRIVVKHANTGTKDEKSTYIEIDRAAPSIEFTKDYADISEPKNAREYDQSRDGDLLGKKISFTFKKDGSILKEEPSKLRKSITMFEFDTDEKKYRETEIKLKSIKTDSSKKSITITEALTGGADNITPFPLGGVYRMDLTAIWKDGKKSEAATYFKLPEPSITILKKAGSKESKKFPRIVSKGDSIKISNWMHSWETFDYQLTVQELIDDEWKTLEGEAPIKIIKNEDKSVKIEVTDDFSGKLKYEISFGPAEDNDLSELVQPTIATGYIESKSSSWLPYILIALGIGSISLLAWNFIGKRL